MKKTLQMPTSQEVEQELKRENYKHRYRKTLKSTIFALITAAAAAVLVATLLLPVLQIYGSSMSPTLEEKQIVVSVKDKELEAGDIVAFYYGSKVLIKRYIAGPGDWVDVLEDGTILVNGDLLDEQFAKEHECKVTVLSMQPPRPADSISHVVAGFGLMHAMGIRPEEFD